MHMRRIYLWIGLGGLMLAVAALFNGPETPRLPT